MTDDIPAKTEIMRPKMPLTMPRPSRTTQASARALVSAPTYNPSLPHHVHFEHLEQLENQDIYIHFSHDRRLTAVYDDRVYQAPLIITELGHLCVNQSYCTPRKLVLYFSIAESVTLHVADRKTAGEIASMYNVLDTLEATSAIKPVDLFTFAAVSTHHNADVVVDGLLKLRITEIVDYQIDGWIIEFELLSPQRLAYARKLYLDRMLATYYRLHRKQKVSMNFLIDFKHAMTTIQQLDEAATIRDIADWHANMTPHFGEVDAHIKMMIERI